MPDRERPVVLLDRDGTIIVDRGYLSRVADVAFEPNAIAGLKALAALPAALVVVTNQSGIGRGLFDAEAMEAVHRHIDGLLKAEGVVISAWHHCPHLPEEGCDCRKPAAGMLLRAVEAEGVDPGMAIMIGDRMSDMQSARSAGASGLLVLTGEGARHVDAARAAGFGIARDLLDAARQIGRRMGKSDA